MLERNGGHTKLIVLSYPALNRHILTLSLDSPLGSVGLFAINHIEC